MMRRTTTIPKVVNSKLLPSYCGIQRHSLAPSSLASIITTTTGEEDNDLMTNSTRVALNTTFSTKQYHKPSIKPFERDLLKYGQDFHVFRPYVNLVAPLFVKTVLDNEHFMNKLDDLERQVIHRIIQHVYQEAIIEFELDDIDCLCRFLFVLQTCRGELVEVKRNLLQCFQHKITVSNVLDVIDSIDNHLEWLESFGNSPVNRSGEEQPTLLDAVKSYCYSFVRQHVFEQEFDIKLNPRVEKHILHFYNKKEQLSVEWNEKPIENSSSFIFEELFNEGEALDYDFTIDFGDGIFIRAHKTILASNSLFFESMLSSSSASYVDVDKSIFYPDSSINASALYCLVEYSYGVLNPSHINQNNILALIQMAHEHDIPTLMEQCIPLLRQVIRLSNVPEMFQFCEQFYGHDTFLPFTNIIISFGSLHAKSLFNAYSKQILSNTPLTLSAIFELYLKK